MGAAVGGKNLEAGAIDMPARPCRAEDSRRAPSGSLAAASQTLPPRPTFFATAAGLRAGFSAGASRADCMCPLSPIVMPTMRASCRLTLM
jgi:hypothetical protein